MALPEQAPRAPDATNALPMQGGLPPPAPTDGLVISYLGLRKAVGILGIALPFVLVFGNILIFSAGIQSSISAYYYTGMRDVFVGTVCAIAVFMISYHGPERADDIFGDLACLFALGVALLPTAPDVNATALQKHLGIAHYLCALGLFGVLAWFCVLFRKTAPQRVRVTRQKKQRNVVYAICGIIIVACIAGIAIVGFLGDEVWLKAARPVLVLETIALAAFGFAWLTKGEAILKDQPPATDTGAAKIGL